MTTAADDYAAEVIKIAREVARWVPPSSNLFGLIEGKALNFGVDGYEGGLAVALARYDAAIANEPIPDKVRRPRQWDTFDAWRSSDHPVKAHPTEKVCVMTSPPWGPMGAGASCRRPIHRVRGKWQHAA